ncbi:hypothetical protein SOPP22_13610 [Shewanella sp. OPT22]|nr:hypothetical protein SOPP22_13610 [Shewanella sp. OPT22]
MQYAKFVVFLFALILMNGCNQDEADKASPVTITGKISDIPLQNAIACLDCNSNYQCELTELNTYTDFEGAFAFENVASEKAHCPLTVETNENTISLVTGNSVELNYTLSAPNGYLHISGITTLLMHQLTKSDELKHAKNGCLSI